MNEKSLSKKSGWLTILQIVGTSTFLLLLFFNTDVSKAFAHLRGIAVWSLFISLLLAATRPLIIGLRYHRGAGRFESAPVSICIRASYVGTMYSMVLPSSIGGDVIRMEWIQRASVTSRTDVFVNIIHERAWGMGVLGAVLLISLLFIPPPPNHGYLFMFVGLIVFVLAYAIQLGVDRRETNRSPLDSAGPFIVGSFALQVCSILVSVVLAFGMGFSMNEILALWTALPIIWLVSTLPISIGGLGVREAGLGVILPLYGWSVESSIALGIATSFALLLTSLIGLPAQWGIHSTPPESE